MSLISYLVIAMYISSCEHVTTGNDLQPWWSTKTQAFKLLMNCHFQGSCHSLPHCCVDLGVCGCVWERERERVFLHDIICAFAVMFDATNAHEHCIKCSRPWNFISTEFLHCGACLGVLYRWCCVSERERDRERVLLLTRFFLINFIDLERLINSQTL